MERGSNPGEPVRWPLATGVGLTGARLKQEPGRGRAQAGAPQPWSKDRGLSGPSVVQFSEDGSECGPRGLHSIGQCGLNCRIYLLDSWQVLPSSRAICLYSGTCSR